MEEMIEEATKTEEEMLEMEIVEFWQYVEALPVRFYPRIYAALTGAKEMLMQGVASGFLEYKELESNGEFKPEGEKFRGILSYQSSACVQLKIIEQKGKIVEHFDIIKAPNCFKN